MSRTQAKINNNGVKAILAPFRWLLVQFVFFFVGAGTLRVSRAWIYFSIAFVFTVLSTMIMWRYIPEVANERGSFKKDTKAWDKVLLSIFILTSITIMPLVSGLDVERYKWSSLDSAFSIMAMVVYAVAVLLNHWAMIENRHFEGTARIQKDRNHTVITTGPYRIIRHPGYFAMILSTISIPVIIGSRYGLIPAALIVIIVVIRTDLEDRLLKKELNGYTEYSKKVRYRLFPGIW
jgi:protein-S-isoprenylcysteine O-methyltransferase Ste14